MTFRLIALALVLGTAHACGSAHAATPEPCMAPIKSHNHNLPTQGELDHED